MAALAAIHEGMATNLASIPATQISAWMLSNPTPPTIEISGVTEITYDTAMQRGGDTYEIVVTGFVAAVTDIGAQKLRSRWLDSSGALSVKAALQSDRTLGGVVDDLRVTRAEGNLVFRVESTGGVLAARWYVQVETSH